MLENVARDEGFVDTRVFVRSEVLQGIFRDALMPCGFCAFHCNQYMVKSCRRKGETAGVVPLLGGMVGDVTGSGKDMSLAGRINLYKGSWPCGEAGNMRRVCRCRLSLVGWDEQRDGRLWRASNF